MMLRSSTRSGRLRWSSHRAARQGMARFGRSQDLLHRAWVAVGEKLRGEFPRQAAGRTVGPGGVRHGAGGASADRAVPHRPTTASGRRGSGPPVSDRVLRRAGDRWPNPARSNMESRATILGQLKPAMVAERTEIAAVVFPTGAARRARQGLPILRAGSRPGLAGYVGSTTRRKTAVRWCNARDPIGMRGHKTV